MGVMTMAQQAEPACPSDCLTWEEHLGHAGRLLVVEVSVDATRARSAPPLVVNPLATERSGWQRAGVIALDVLADAALLAARARLEALPARRLFLDDEGEVAVAAASSPGTVADQAAATTQVSSQDSTALVPREVPLIRANRRERELAGGGAR